MGRDRALPVRSVLAGLFIMVYGGAIGAFAKGPGVKTKRTARLEFRNLAKARSRYSSLTWRKLVVAVGVNTRTVFHRASGLIPPLTWTPALLTPVEH